MADKYVDKFIDEHPVKNVLIDGVTRNYLIGGKGKTGFLVFPGSGQDLLSCYDLVDEFEDDYKVIVVTYSGFKTLESFFRYVCTILDQERINKVILYGLSMGGFLGYHFVKCFPEKVDTLILSHSSTTKSVTTIKRVVIPGKILNFLLPLIPLSLVKWVITKNSGKAQSGSKDVGKLWNEFSTKENSERRREMYNKVGLTWLTKDYLNSIYSLGTEMEEIEKRDFTVDVLKVWRGKILIIRTDNDPLAQDDGVFKTYFPQAKVIIFKTTGHLTPFIRFEEIAKTIRGFVQ